MGNMKNRNDIGKLDSRMILPWIYRNGKPHTCSLG